MSKKLKNEDDELYQYLHEKLEERREAGLNSLEHPHTLHAHSRSVLVWLNELEEELIDSLVYIQMLREMISPEEGGRDVQQDGSHS